MLISKRSRTNILLALALCVVLPLAGCAKKAGNADVVVDPNAGKNSGNQNDGSNQGDGTRNPDAQEGRNASNQFGLKDIFFNYDDATLSGEARGMLSNNAAIMNEMSSLKALIEGHCDERGTVEYNLALGQRRADATRNYLVNLGVDGMRLTARSLGEERPFASGDDESAWSQNRRAHFVVTNQ